MTKPTREPRRRRQITLATLMGLIALSALLLMFLTPLVRYGVPPCQTHGNVLRWLLSAPGRASCASCHEMTSASDYLTSKKLAITTATDQQPRNIHQQGDRHSCAACHQPVPSS